MGTNFDEIKKKIQQVPYKKNNFENLFSRMAAILL